MDIFFQWLSAIPFGGGGFNDAAIAEGLAEALMVCGDVNSFSAHLYLIHFLCCSNFLQFYNCSC